MTVQAIPLRIQHPLVVTMFSTMLIPLLDPPIVGNSTARLYNYQSAGGVREGLREQ